MNGSFVRQSEWVGPTMAEPAPSEEETLLLARLRRAEPPAFDDLVRQYGVQMLAVARGILVNDEDSADSVQDAFVSAFQNLGSFRGTCRLSTWLHRIVVNTSLMKLRARSRRPVGSIEELLPRFDESGHHAQSVRRWSERPDQQMTLAETRRQVRDCIDRLPDDYRIVLLLRDIEELDTQRTAEHLGVSQAVVKTRLHRARQALRTLLDPLFRE
jgi:RNA polymerase sigma-70 factor (ECF subfamily)